MARLAPPSELGVKVGQLGIISTFVRPVLDLILGSLVVFLLVVVRISDLIPPQSKILFLVLLAVVVVMALRIVQMVAQW